MLNLFILGCVRLGNPDLDFQNLHSDFPIERTLSVISFIESRSDSCDIGFSYNLANVASTINNKNAQVKAENFKCYVIRTRPAKNRQGPYNVKKLYS